MCPKRIYVGAIFGVLLAVLALAAAPAAAQQANVPRIAPDLADKTAEQVYKNIQVLKGTPAGQVLPLMRLINLSLGVACEHCHDAMDRSLDGQDAKDTARSMMSMVNELNKNSFSGQPTMTCYSCHRGAVEPVAQAILPDPDDPIVSEEKMPVAASYPSADQIIAKYIEALGGEQTLRAVTSRMVTATGDLPAELRNEPRVSARIEHYQKAPNMELTVTHMPAGAVSTGFDGQAAWMQDAMGVVTQFTGLELKQLIDRFDKSCRSFVSTLELQYLHAFFINRYSAHRLPAVLQLGGKSVVLTLTGFSIRHVTADAENNTLVLIDN